MSLLNYRWHTVAHLSVNTAPGIACRSLKILPNIFARNSRCNMIPTPFVGGGKKFTSGEDAGYYLRDAYCV